MKKNYKDFGVEEWQKSDDIFIYYSEEMYSKFEKRLSYEETTILAKYQILYQMYRMPQTSKEIKEGVVETVKILKEQIDEVILETNDMDFDEIDKTFDEMNKELKDLFQNEERN